MPTVVTSLMEGFLTEMTVILWQTATLHTKMTIQGAFAPVRPTALMTWVRLRATGRSHNSWHLVKT